MTVTSSTNQLKLVGILRGLGLSLLLLFIAAGCTSTAIVEHDDKLISSILNYETLLPENHPDTQNKIFKLSDEVRTEINRKFKSRDRHRTARDLARWLTSPDGHNLTYDLEANLTPAQAFEQRRGNCLSFTLLLVELASELNIDLQVNQVDLPDMWGQDEQKDLIFYRHVNAVLKTKHSTQIFDLAMEQYRPGFPQRLIDKRQATALLFSNIGIEELKKSNIKSAIHYLRLSVSIFPSNPDMWINLGAAYKHIGNLDIAEKIYLKAFSISDVNNLAASNLERLYRRQNQIELADRFKKLAIKSRARNPYFQYQNAQLAYQEKNFLKASKLIKRAIRLHKEDPDFYELSSRIKQSRNKHLSALKDLAKAHELSTTAEERGRYASKVKMVIARAKELQEQQSSQSSDSSFDWRRVQLLDLGF